jgi:hypothetical protein
MLSKRTASNSSRRTVEAREYGYESGTRKKLRLVEHLGRMRSFDGAEPILVDLRSNRGRALKRVLTGAAELPFRPIPLAIRYPGANNLRVK